VELITVVAILGILITLTVGAVQGVRNYVARKATEEILAALDAALQRYYDDWGKYPETVTPPGTGESVYSQVSDTYIPVSNPSPAYAQNARDAMLYAALTMTQRGGPYFKGGMAQARVFRLVDGTSYRAFADGWGREIRYKPASSTLSSTLPSDLQSATKPPILQSLGADPDDSIEEGKKDDMLNRTQ
jgi:type II secretory pathway pseudopilin PulG